MRYRIIEERYGRRHSLFYAERRVFCVLWVRVEAFTGGACKYDNYRGALYDVSMDRMRRRRITPPMIIEHPVSEDFV